jgi:O-antigen/teichoic acid export membrane protein
MKPPIACANEDSYFDKEKVGQRAHLTPVSKESTRQQGELQTVDTEISSFNGFGRRVVETTSSSIRATKQANPLRWIRTPTVSALVSGEQALFARQLIKNSGIYAIASIATPLVTLLLAPFLTHHLTRSEYGSYAILNTALALLAGLSQLGLNSAFFRSYNYDYEIQSDRLDVLATVVDLLFLVTIPLSIAIIITAPWLSLLLFNDPAFIAAVRLVGVVILLQNLTVPGLTWFRAESRAVSFSMVSVLNLLVTVSVTVLCVGVLDMGVVGSLIGIGGGYAATLSCTLPIILLRAGVRLRLDIAVGLLSFGLPNVSNFVAVWVLQLSDRFLLGHLGSLAQAASYSVAYSLGGALGAIVLAPFTLAWPTAMFSIAKKNNAAEIFSAVFRWYCLFLLFVALGLSFAGVAVLDLFFPPSYHRAASVIPIIALSIVFYGAYNIMTTAFSLKRKTWFAVIFTSTSALFNVALNLVFIPHFGSMGAAFSTLFAYGLLALLAYMVGQQMYPIPYEIGRFFVGLFIGVALYVGSDILAQSRGTFAAWGIYLVTLALYAGCLVILLKLPRWDKSINRKNG